MISPNQAISVEAVARHYDELDAFYRDAWGEHVHHVLWLKGSETPEEAVGQLSEYAARLGGIEPGQHVCDVGSGYGATARLLAKQFGAQVTALTVTPRQKDFADAVDPGATNPRYLLGDFIIQP